MEPEDLQNRKLLTFYRFLCNSWLHGDTHLAKRQEA